MADPTTIVNRALLSIGARAQVSSISPSDGSTEADAGAVLFTPTFESLARSAHWNCLRKQEELSLVKAAIGTPENINGTTLPQPPSPWLYEYEVPSDSLNIRFLVPSLPALGTGTPQTTINNVAPIWFPGGGQIPFAVVYDTDTSNNPMEVILTNQSQAQAVYTVNEPNPQQWDSLFQEAMVSSLAAYFVPALSLHVDLMKAQIGRAETLIARARVADGNEGVTVMDHVPDWIRARGTARGCYWWNQGGFQYGGYTDMCWPG